MLYEVITLITGMEGVAVKMGVGVNVMVGEGKGVAVNVGRGGTVSRPVTGIPGTALWTWMAERVCATIVLMKPGSGVETPGELQAEDTTIKTTNNLRTGLTLDIVSPFVKTILISYNFV